MQTGLSASGYSSDTHSLVGGLDRYHPKKRILKIGGLAAFPSGYKRPLHMEFCEQGSLTTLCCFGGPQVTRCGYID